MPRKPRAEYEIGAKDESARGWRDALSTADRSGKKLTGIMKAAFAGISIGAITSAIKASFELGDEIGKAAVKAGIGAQAMSELAFAARMSDIDIQSLSVSIRKMQVELSKASTGGKEQKEALDALGLSLSDLKRMKADEQFEVIGDAIMRLRDPTDRARASTALFGRAGAELLPMFQQGAAGIREAREEAIRLGAALSEEQVRLLQEGDDAIKRLSAAWDGWMAKLAVGTVHLAEALDLIDRDKVGELQDELARVNNELLRVPRSAELGGTPLDPETFDRLTTKAAALERQIANLNDTYTRGGGSRRGRGTKAPPGFGGSTGTPGFSQQDFDSLMDGADLRRNVAMWDNWRKIVDETDRDITAGILETNKDLADSFDDMKEPILQAGDAMSVFKDEAQRNMQDWAAEFLYNIGDVEGGWRGFLKEFVDIWRHAAAEIAATQLFGPKSAGGTGAFEWFSNLLTGFFSGSSSSSSSGGADALSTMMGLYGYADGTNYVTHDQLALIHKGEAVVPAKYNPAGVSAPVVNINTSIDARGATTDAVKALPEILRRNNDALEARIVRRLKAGKYG